jgi:hypothetical protein
MVYTHIYFREHGNGRSNTSCTDTISTSKVMAPVHIKAVDEEGFSSVSQSSGQRTESSGLKQEQADEFKAKLEELGAIIELVYVVRLGNSMQ